MCYVPFTNERGVIKSDVGPELRKRSGGGQVVKLLACGARGPGSIPGLAT